MSRTSLRICLGFFTWLAMAQTAPATCIPLGKNQQAGSSEIQLLDDGTRCYVPYVAPEAVKRDSKDNEGHSILDEDASYDGGDGAIYNRCLKEWGTDYRMLDWCINQQQEARTRVHSRF